ncbi:hypothetical protein EON66_08495 [archaeon]|nr:MAG: hypothetical protein EON66_08495 [archaeon]
MRCAFDGRNERDLTRGQFVVVQSSPWPLPLICRRTACGDWIRAIKNKLYWNVRLRQKPFAALQRADSIGEERVGTAIESEADNTYAASPLGFTQHAESAPSVPTVPSRTRAPSASSSEAYHLPRTLYRYWNPVPTTVPHRAPSSNVPVHTAQPLDESLSSVTEPIAAVTSLSIDTTNERTGAEEQRMAVVERVPGVTPLRAVGITSVVAAAQGGAALSPISRSRSAWVCVPASDRRASTAPAADDVNHGESTQSRAEFCLEEEDPDEEDMVDQLEAELEHDSD